MATQDHTRACGGSERFIVQVWGASEHAPERFYGPFKLKDDAQKHADHLRDQIGKRGWTQRVYIVHACPEVPRG